MRKDDHRRFWFLFLFVSVSVCLFVLSRPAGPGTPSPDSAFGTAAPSYNPAERILAPGGAETSATQPGPIRIPAAPRYGRSQLQGAAAYVYDTVLAALAADPAAESVDLSPDQEVTQADATCGFNVFLNDFPECFWLTGGFRSSINGSSHFLNMTFNRLFSAEELPAAQARFSAAAAQLLEGLSGSPYEVALTLHDRVAAHITYKSGTHDQTAYGAIAEGQAVCAGYVRAYQFLLSQAGIRGYYLSGTADNGTSPDVSHAWLMMWLDEDTCVFTDITWDDPGDSLFHRYFCLSLAEMSADHTFDAKYVRRPECSHDGWDYFSRGLGFTLTEHGQAIPVRYLTETGPDTYTAVIRTENTGLINSAIRPTLVLLGYKNALSCAYTTSNSHVSYEYHLTIRVVGGVKESEAPPTQPSETLAPPTDPAPTQAPPTQPPETLAPPTDTAPTQAPETSAPPTAPAPTQDPPTQPPETSAPEPTEMPVIPPSGTEANDPVQTSAPDPSVPAQDSPAGPDAVSLLMMTAMIAAALIAVLIVLRVLLKRR